MLDKRNYPFRILSTVEATSGKEGGMKIDRGSQLQQKLYNSPDLLAGIITTAMDAIIVIDDTQRIVLFNTAAENMFGCSSRSAIGSSLERFVPERFREAYRKQVRHFRDTGETTQIMGRPGTVWGLRADGDEFPIEASIAQTTACGLRVFTVVIRDITERVRAEGKLESSERRIRDFLLNSPIPMVVSRGPHYECELVNLKFTELFGYTIQDMPDEAHWWPLAYPEKAYRQAVEAQWRDHLQRATSQSRRQILPMEAIVHCKDGSKRKIEFHFAFIGDFNLVSFVDLTERRQAEEALWSANRRLIEAQEQERARIGRELHDDVNQRLAMLAVELEQLHENPLEIHSRVQELRSRITEISNDVQALSHDLHASKLEYLGVAGGIKSWCKEFAERQKIEIDCRHEVKSSWPAEIGICLFRVLQEALHNAAKHSGVKRIEVHLTEESGEIQLTVSDSGRGFNIDAARQGRGLGLMSMHERVRLVNGTFSIESKPMGGTTIRVRLPLKWNQEQYRVAG